MITTKQIRAARGILNWNQADLAEATGISLSTINNLDRKNVKAPRLETLKRIQEAFEREGIEFIDGGVREAQKTVEHYSGPRSLIEVYNDIFETLANSEDKELLIFGADESKFMADEHIHSVVLSDIPRRVELGLEEKLLSRHGDSTYYDPPEAYRWVPEQYFFGLPIWVYGGNFAMFTFDGDTESIIIKNAKIAEVLRRIFYQIWDSAEIPPFAQEALMRKEGKQKPARKKKIS